MGDRVRKRKTENECFIDGSTIAYPPPTSTAIRRGLKASPFNFTIWLFVLVVLLLVLLILYLCYYKCKEKRSTSRVGSMDANQRLVSGVDANVSPPQPSHHTAVGNVNLVPTTAFTSSLVAHSNDASIRVPNYETNTSFQQGDLSLDKQQQQQQQQMMPSCQIAQQMSFNEDGMMGINALGTDKSITATTTPTTVKMDRWTDTRGANHASTLPTLIGETTATTTRNDNHHYHQHATSRTADDKLMMRIRRNQFFERPRVAVLDNVSAISLDEFWSKNDRPFRSGK